MKSRKTRQKELLEEEVKTFRGFFSAEDLLKKASQKDDKMGIATVYRYLKELRKKDLIYSYTCNGKTIYSLENKSHCHFECVETGEIFHFEIDNLDFLKDKIPGEIESVQLEVKGVCKEHKNI